MELEDFAKTHHKKWEGIYKAKELSEKNRKIIAENFFKDSIPPYSSDVDFVMFGSIARNECTSGSDLDWTLLIDGQANSEHLNTSFNIKRIIKEKIAAETNLNDPGATGMFGQITFSHDLIHNIGGEEDTNHNITRRILLLLESEKIIFENRTSGTAYDRVARGIIKQYIEHDSGLRHGGKMPRFLLNDIIRFWRTMCVDFAWKQKEQEGERWALRNLKLRMFLESLFMSKAWLMCFSSYYNSNSDIDVLQNHFLQQCVDKKPLDFILSVLTSLKVSQSNIIQLFDTYNAFLELLDDKEYREHLRKLPPILCS